MTGGGGGGGVFIYYLLFGYTLLSSSSVYDYAVYNCVSTLTVFCTAYVQSYFIIQRHTFQYVIKRTPQRYLIFEMPL